MTAQGPGESPAAADRDVETFTSDDPAETARIASDLADGLEPGDVVLLNGEVGVGKSTFARAAMKALGVEGAIPSPTFTIGRLYYGRDRLPVAHLDLYRIGSIEEEDPGLLVEYLDPRGIVFAEWPGEGSNELIRRGKRSRTVMIEHVDRDRRLIRISGPARG
jgi:tRNA threonylcarbamoyladenosine biosynthesis protein TsaE